MKKKTFGNLNDEKKTFGNLNEKNIYGNINMIEKKYLVTLR